MCVLLRACDSRPSPINQPVPCSWITKDLTVKVTEQFNEQVNWLYEIRLYGHWETNKTEFNFNEGDNETWPLSWDATLEPLATVTRSRIFGKEMDEKEDLLLEIWSEAPESSIQGLGLSMDWEIYAVAYAC